MSTVRSKLHISYSAMLFAVALTAALFFNGIHLYFLSLSWFALILFTAYQFSKIESVRITFDATFAVIALFVLWMLISLYWHPVPWQGAYYNWRLGIYFYVLMAAYYLLRDVDVVDLLKGVFLVGMADVLLTLVQSLFMHQSADGFFINKNNNAAFLNLFMLPAMSMLLFGSKRWSKSWFAGVVFIAVFLAMLQVSSRGAFIGLIAATAILFAFALYEKRLASIALVCMLAVIALLIDAMVSSVELKGHLESHSRWLLWSSTFEMIRDSKWYGIGNGMFYLVYPGYRHPDELSGGYFVHNDYLQILLELGIPGFAMLLLFLVTIILRFRKLVINARSFGDVGLYLGLFAAIIAVAIHSLFTFNFYLTGILFVMGVYTGIIIRRAAVTEGVKTLSYTFRFTQKRIAVAVVLMLLSIKPIMFAGYADAIVDGVISDALSANTPAERYQLYSKLWEWDSENYLYPYLMANAYSSDETDNRLSARTEILQKSRLLLQKAKTLNPYAYELYINEAGLINRFQDVVGARWSEEAIPLAEKALELNPRQYQVRMKAAQLMESAGYNERALGVMLEGLEQNRNCDLPYYEYGNKLALELGRNHPANRFLELAEEEKAKIKKAQDDWIREYMSPRDKSHGS